MEDLLTKSLNLVEVLGGLEFVTINSSDLCFD